MKVKIEFEVEDFYDQDFHGSFEEFLRYEMKKVVRDKIKEKMKRNPVFKEFIKVKSDEALAKFLKEE